MRREYDVIVIGSGFGGAVTACRLAQAGRSVCLLERGRRWSKQEFPRPDGQAPRWKWNPPASDGLFEMHSFRRMSVLVASGVGGGSLVYTNVQKRAPAVVFREGWPPEISRHSLDPYYDRVEAMLEPSPPPIEAPKARALREAARRAGRQSQFESPKLAIYWGQPGREVTNRHGARQTGCIHCGLCAFGCHVHAKNTLDLNYLKAAQHHGADIRSLHEAIKIEPAAEGYRVTHKNLATDPAEESTIIGRQVVVAAGTLGSVKLLLRGKEYDKTLPAISPRLGSRFSGNGDFFALALQTDLDVQPTYGPTVSALMNYWDGLGFTLMEGGVPDFVAAKAQKPLTAYARWLGAWSSLRNGLLAPLGLARDRPRVPPPFSSASPEEAVRHVIAFLLMGVDGSDGLLRLNPQGELDLRWRYRRTRPLLKEMKRASKELRRAMNAHLILNPLWWLKRKLATVHPLGGCALARDQERGVVSHQGEVFGYPNLFVADGSIIPRALGIPPSMTIAALAERVAEGMIENRRLRVGVAAGCSSIERQGSTAKRQRSPRIRQGLRAHHQ